MKRSLAFLLALALLAAAAPVALAQAAAPASLTVAAVSEMSGFFYTDLWGANTSDMDVRGLIHGYGTIAWQREGRYAVDDTVVSSLQTGLDANGDKLYRFTLQSGLYWNNGQPITVEDYLFTILLQSSPELAALGVNNENYRHLRGWDAFSQNSAAPFSGVHIVNANTFTLTVKSEHLPYFYELMLVQVQPTPMAAVAPGLTVADDGDGAYLTAAPGQTAAFTAELLAQTLLGDNGYVHHPAVTCGPFSLTRYDAAAHVAEFDQNPYYKGNYEGRRAEVAHLTFRALPSADMLTALQNGEVDIVNKVSDGAVIAKGLEMVNADQARSATYMRSGFAFIAFACEDATTSQLSARQAIAMSVNVDEICTQTMNGYAMPAYGYYGLGQWMASQDTERLASLSRYGYDPIGAKNLLSADGWTYNADGAPFIEETDKVRYKIVNDALVPLEMRVAVGKGGVAAERIAAQLQAAAAMLGASLTVTELTLSEMLPHYYRQEPRTYNMFLMGTNFSHVFDPYYAFNTADEYQGVTNTTGLRDEKLMQLADDMRGVEAGDSAAYEERWFAFQERWVELLPMIPLYSNVYFDFVRPDLYNYEISAHWGWSSAIMDATFTKPEETVAVAQTPQP